jgi:divalent metal cation (Fe/Co/Zn/Cd) transporter
MIKGSSKISVIQYISIFYNLIEAFFAILFGMLAQSIALTGFGLNSVAELVGNYFLARQLKQSAADPETMVTKIKQKPMVLSAVLSFIFGSYVLVQSIKLLILRMHPEPSLPGIVIAIFSLFFLPLQAFWSYRQGGYSFKIAFKMGVKDIWAYMFLSLGLLLGLALNFSYGIWQADPWVGLITAVYLYKKSLESLLGGKNGSDFADPFDTSYR